MDLESLVRRAAAGDLDAFADLTRRFQHMAFGYALSLVRDLSHAEDVVQEAFVAAWFGLGSLSDPAAFPGWLRGIVRHQAFRLLRRKHLEAVPLALADGVAAPGAGPDDRVEHRQRVTTALAAVARLPRPQREVVTLYYVHECSQQDIATFLGLPVTTVNDRLHAARAQLKRRTLTMVKDTLEAHQLPDDFAARVGRIVRARDNVIEARFDPGSLPDVLTELAVSDGARQRAVTAQVIQRLGDGVVRCVALSPIDALEPGMTVMSSGRHLATPVSREGFERTVKLLAGPPETPADGQLLETGIKVVDVMSPLVSGGTAAIAGEYAAGTLVLVEELVRRLSGVPGRVSLFTFVPGPSSGSFEETWKKEGYSEGTVGAVQTFFFRSEDEPWTPERLSSVTGVDTVVRLSRELARRRIYPTIDPLTSRSRLLDERRVSEEHLDVARGVREALAALRVSEEGREPADALIVARARKLERFFAQPFFAAEPYTRRPGVRVSLAEALRGCREILDGLHDDVPEEAFYFTETIDDVRRRAGQ